jgi:hypothetical protein
MQQQRQSRGALDESTDGAATTGTEYEIPLPVPRDRAVLHLRGSITDHHHVGDLPATRSRLTFAVRAPRAQAASQLSAQFSSALNVKGLVDGFVAHAHLGVVGIDQR